MFLRATTRKKDGKTHRYWSVVENRRLPGGRVLQRHVLYLGEINSSQERAWRRSVEVFDEGAGGSTSLALFPDDRLDDSVVDGAVVRLRLSQLRLHRPRVWGSCWLVLQLWEQLGLERFWSERLPANRKGTRWDQVLFVLVAYRLLSPGSEWRLHRQWFERSALSDLLGVDAGIADIHKLYACHDRLLAHKTAVFDHLVQRWRDLFNVEFDVLLYDLTSTYFEGLAEANELAARGYSRDHRRDCKQVVLALVVTRDGFPLAHFTLKGNTQDLATVQQVVRAVETRFGQLRRVWVMDRGMISDETLRFLKRSGRQFLLALRRSALKQFAPQLRARTGWQRLAEHEEVEVKLVRRRGQHYLLARSQPRRRKERAMRRRQRRGLAKDLRKLQTRVAQGRLKDRDKILERVGRLQQRYPKARALVTVAVARKGTPALTCTWHVERFRAALAADGAYVLQSNRGGWTPSEFWETYMQLAMAEKAFRVLKSEICLRPVWHQYSGRVQAHVFICVLAYALWKTLDHLAKQAGLLTPIRKPAERRHGQAVPKPRPMTPAVILRELGRIQIGDIVLQTTDGRQLLLRRVARPDAEQKRILEALKLELPERLSPDRLL